MPRDPSAPFSDPDAVARYAEGVRRRVPGHDALLRMAGLLLAEGAPAAARILVVGAGGGLETRALAEAHPGWRFDGVDPSAPMLDLARRTLGPLAARAALHQGTVEAAPEGPFDGATCLLTLHFVPEAERGPTLRAIRRRLRPGARLVCAQFSLPEGEGRARGLARNAAWLVSAGEDPEAARRSGEAIAAGTHILAPERDEALLREAGFVEVELVYAALAFRGWVAVA